MNNTFTGNENFYNEDTPLDFNLRDFWSWYASDLLNHAVRGAVAEYIVGKTLGINSPKPGWEYYDIKYKNKLIEVKSSASIGAKNGKQNTRIVFNIKKQLCCKPEDIDHGFCTKAELWKKSCRHSDIYIFCHFKEENINIADPLRLEQWDFYILPTEIINSNLQDRQTIRIPQILALGGIKCAWDELKKYVDSVN